MTFSVNFLWMRDGALAPELSITLPAVVHGKREPFWSFPGELDTVRFLVVPHFRLDRTITVWSDPVVPPGPMPRKQKWSRSRLPHRPAWTNPCAFACCWRL
ncbi:MAG: hypothetical protein HPZ91_14750 [Lentisphaeria bacterium]|nr:hypothetical protein [Lentisphaeria bacterium]